jgi:hypothetical protein
MQGHSEACWWARLCPGVLAVLDRTGHPSGRRIARKGLAAIIVRKGLAAIIVVHLLSAYPGSRINGGSVGGGDHLIMMILALIM